MSKYQSDISWVTNYHSDIIWVLKLPRQSQWNPASCWEAESPRVRYGLWIMKEGPKQCHCGRSEGQGLVLQREHWQCHKEISQRSPRGFYNLWLLPPLCCYVSVCGVSDTEVWLKELALTLLSLHFHCQCLADFHPLQPPPQSVDLSSWTCPEP